MKSAPNPNEAEGRPRSPGTAGWRERERAAQERIRADREAADAARAAGSGRLRVLGRAAARLNAKRGIKP